MYWLFIPIVIFNNTNGEEIVLNRGWCLFFVFNTPMLDTIATAWPKLESVHLENAIFSEDLFTGSIRRHASTLRILSCAYPFLKEDSWPQFLSKLRTLIADDFVHCRQVNVSRCLHSGELIPPAGYRFNSVCMYRFEACTLPDGESVWDKIKNYIMNDGEYPFDKD